MRGTTVMPRVEIVRSDSSLAVFFGIALEAIWYNDGLVIGGEVLDQRWRRFHNVAIEPQDPGCVWTDGCEEEGIARERHRRPACFLILQLMPLRFFLGLH